MCDLSMETPEAHTLTITFAIFASFLAFPQCNLARPNNCGIPC